MNNLANKASKRRQVERARAFIQGYKETHRCTDCHEIFPYYVMDFDHVRGTKRCDVSDLVAKGRSLDMIKAEIAKCDLVCANDHRVCTFARHYEKISK